MMRRGLWRKRCIWNHIFHVFAACLAQLSVLALKLLPLKSIGITENVLQFVWPPVFRGHIVKLFWWGMLLLPYRLCEVVPFPSPRTGIADKECRKRWYTSPQTVYKYQSHRLSIAPQRHKVQILQSTEKVVQSQGTRTFSKSIFLPLFFVWKFLLVRNSGKILFSKETLLLDWNKTRKELSEEFFLRRLAYLHLSVDLDVIMPFVYFATVGTLKPQYLWAGNTIVPLTHNGHKSSTNYHQ